MPPVPASKRRRWPCYSIRPLDLLLFISFLCFWILWRNIWAHQNDQYTPTKGGKHNRIGRKRAKEEATRTAKLFWKDMKEDFSNIGDVNVSAAQVYELPLDEPVQRMPTNHACDNFTGLYHIQSGDVGGALGTIFFQFVIAQLIYAEEYNLIPWVHMNNISHYIYDWDYHSAGRVQFKMLEGMSPSYSIDPRYDRARFPGPLEQRRRPLRQKEYVFMGDGVWEHYFEPVSDFVPGDTSCERKPYTTMDLWLLTPGVHIYYPKTPRIWRYDVLPKYMWDRHLPIREWLEPQRLKAHAMTKKYIKVKPFLRDLALRVNSDSNCVGMHVRWSDKEGGRRKIGVDEFLPYVQAFLDNGGSTVFVATDSDKVLQHIQENWPEDVRKRVKSQGDNVVRSNDETPVFVLDSHHRTNVEILIDILSLSYCPFMLHGLSAVTDSAMYLNGDLIYQSVDLEDPARLHTDAFGSMVNDVLSGTKLEKSKFFPPHWWEHRAHKTRKPTHKACNGYKGILHIAVGEPEAGMGMIFFHYVLNQLIYADMNNLKPWVHLSKNTTKRVFDSRVHGEELNYTFQMLGGMGVRVVNDMENPERYYPGDLDVSSKLTNKTCTVLGDGIWANYFQPVSDFEPGDRSCRNKPLVSLQGKMVVPGLYTWAPWAVRSWQYPEIPNDAWKPANMTSSDWYGPMRKKANEIVKKYFQIQPHIIKRAEEVAPPPNVSCLAMHIRRGDKDTTGGRENIGLPRFARFARAFWEAGGKAMYVATDSWDAFDFIREQWRNGYPDLYTQGEHIVRVLGKESIATVDSHHRINSEALVDIIAMSRCQFFVHGYSTLSEAVMYLNVDLHDRAVNLDDPNHMSVDAFDGMVVDFLGHGTSS